METLFILTTSGKHSSATRNDFIGGLQARGATVDLMPSRLGDFEVVKVNGQPVGRAFKSQCAMIEYMASR
jgi:hypothetical protein